MLTTFTAEWTGSDGLFDLEGATLSNSSGQAIDFDYGEYFVIGNLNFGCTDSGACNYDASANADDGSCDYSCLGCTDPDASNYDPDATVDDDSCVYEELNPPANLVALAGDSVINLFWNSPDGGGTDGGTTGGTTGGGTTGGGDAFPVCPDGSAEYIDCADTCFNDADCTGGCVAWLGDGYCDDGTYGLVFWLAGGGCPEWGNDCGDCEGLDDPLGVCDLSLIHI